MRRISEDAQIGLGGARIHRPYSRALSVLLATVLLVAGCTNIPEESTPHAVHDDKVQPSGGVPEPTPNLKPDDLVREFIHSSGNPEAAESYLTEEARATWDSNLPPILIHDTYGVTPPPGGAAGNGADETDDGRATVSLLVNQVGKIGADRAFVPAGEKEEYPIKLRKVNNQWRIDTPPPDRVFVPLADFQAAYLPVTVYYFDNDLRITVPDLRYVTRQPAASLPARVISVLLSGPSDTLGRSVRSPLEGVGTRTNPVPDPDGTLVVDLKPLGEKSREQRELIAAQIVLTLQDVTSSRLRLKGDGQDLIDGHGDWRRSDLKSYDALTKPNPDQPGLMVVDGRLRSLRDGKEIEGPAGNGQYNVISAAQSIDGGQLAVVTQTDVGLRLRVGPFDGPLQEVDLEATTMTRPTWLVSTSSEQSSREVWTVADGNVVRIVPTVDETWTSIGVNTTALETFGRITELRLSRDGTRVAVITDEGRLVVASVVRDNDSVSLRMPRTLQQNVLNTAIGVDWYNQHTLAVATKQATLPVVNVSVDGMDLEAYDRSNLRPPVHAITAAPEREVVVTDNAAIFGVPGIGQLWRQLPHGQGPAAVPFYPG